LDTGLNIKLHFVMSVFWYYFMCLHSCTVFPVLPRHCGLEFSIPPSYSGGAGLESDWHCPPGKYCDILGSTPQPLLPCLSQFR